jgi:hypothetical protein
MFFEVTEIGWDAVRRVYRLEPPATAAPFYFPGQIAAFPAVASASATMSETSRFGLLDSVH